MNATITEQIRSNMNIVLDTLRQIIDKNGCFEFDGLRASGLSRVEVMQAIAFLNKEDHGILKMRSEYGFWRWEKAYWARRQVVA